MKLRQRAWVRGVGVAAAVAIAAVLVSCATFKFKDIVTMPATIPGAEYVGMETCVVCHEKQSKYFKLDSHSTLVVGIKDSDAGVGFHAGGCETCHGPGSLHADSKDKTKILKDSPERCLACHTERLAEFKLQNHHPVLEKQMTCSACHDLHGSSAKSAAARDLKRSDEKCFACHKEFKGPFVFEHDAMRDGCQACHNPHGSVYNKMLVADQTVTCLRCHMDQKTNTTAGLGSGVKHGAGGGNYFIGQGEECVDHHRSVHGSNIWRTFNR